ncbi:hypothetical protein LzC2_30980 [Planctomycetes bacterium LzC2]|uniref:Tetratricopeptide repeat protein n=2 Tax=Alienimonas chondri TaxID=2681879 RepID=A0ABX1VJN0_9PLAN|nr:hypothetical protein [Alienimonas chondri]
MGTMGAGAYGVHWARPVSRPPGERLTEALELIDAHPPPFGLATVEVAEDILARGRAAALAAPLLGEETKGVRPGPPPILPDVPGAAAYVVGLEAFGRASEDRAEDATAAAYLLRAEREGVPPPRRHRFLVATGLSLLRAGRPSLAFVRLERAMQPQNTAGVLELADRSALWAGLVDAALRDGRAETLAAAWVRLASAPVPDSSSHAADLFRARGRIAVERKDASAAADALNQLQRVGGRGGELAVRLALLTDDLPAARVALPPVPRFPLPTDVTPLLLHGRVEEASGDLQLALVRYHAAAETAPDTADALSARLAEARMLTATGRFEEAEEALALAVEQASVMNDEASESLGDELQRACEGAIRAAADSPNGVAHCVALCDTVEPALGAPLARRLKAEVLGAAAGEDPARSAAAARAFAAWATVEPDRDRRRLALLSASRNYRRAGEPAAALAQLDRVPLTGDADPGGLRLERAELLLDLGQAAEARTAADALVHDLPSDPATPAARVLIGRAALEAGDPEGAEAAWTAVLKDSGLTPAAAEWRESLFARAQLAAGRAQAAVPPVALPDATAGDDVGAALTAAAKLLGECLAYYPDDPAADVARLARARCLLARQQRLDATESPVDPLNKPRRDALIAADLTAALADFREVESGLRIEAANADPSPAEVARLRLARLGAAECLTRLGRPEAGAVAVAAAVDQDPLSVRSAAALLDLAAARRASGDEEGGRLAAEQARLTMTRLPEESLAPAASPLSRAEWDRLFLLARRSTEAEAGRADADGAGGDDPPPARNAAP